MSCKLKDNLPLVANEGQPGALIVAETHEYLFSSARDYADEKGYVNVQTEI